MHKISHRKGNNQITQGESFKVWENVQNDLEMTSTPKCTLQLVSKTNSLLSKKKKKKKCNSQLAI